MSGVVPLRQGYWLCREPECDAVYFGEDATVLTASDMNVAPGFKSKSPDALVCYCFQHRRRDIEAELVAEGRTSIPDRITAEVKAGNCACEVRNPSGKCCLGDVQVAVQEISAELGSMMCVDRAMRSQSMTRMQRVTLVGILLAATAVGSSACGGVAEAPSGQDDATTDSTVETVSLHIEGMT